ncbi:MAG: hypothetical protein A2505_03485 [Deltaproteobacteria bacterium RIFOXYD12_FULL_55_16]|nr:MAG: hypothetical protein A2505_03485 [Deltaproteobacteria bacterium RIFOXYD12_FULL_55_16]HCC54437.1 hypothetical protein [Desulfobulbaceae bacterium]
MSYQKESLYAPDSAETTRRIDSLLESINAPILLLQGNPRQVISANRQALALFGKELSEIENHRGGEVFDCVYSFTEAGCGKDPGCEDCPIKNAIVDTFVSGQPHQGVSATLQVKKAGGDENASWCSSPPKS